MIAAGKSRLRRALAFAFPFRYAVSLNHPVPASQN
jgi:hypothetical protein